MNNLKKLRKAKGLNQTQLAHEIGAAQNTVSQWELGTRDIDSERLQELADYFGVSTDYLLGRTNEEIPPTEAEGVDPEVKVLVDLYLDASPEMQAAALGMLRAAGKARADQESALKDK